MKKYASFDVQSNAEIIAPFASASYNLSELFYDLKFPYEVNHGSFFSIHDTIAIQNLTYADNIDEATFIFKAFNIMPFQINLLLVPIDSITNTPVDSLKVIMLEAASYEPGDDWPSPVKSENSLLIDANFLRAVKSANQLYLDANFSWPYQGVRVDTLIDQLAFELEVIIDFKLAQ